MGFGTPARGFLKWGYQKVPSSIWVSIFTSINQHKPISNQVVYQYKYKPVKATINQYQAVPTSINHYKPTKSWGSPICLWTPPQWIFLGLSDTRRSAGGNPGSISRLGCRVFFASTLQCFSGSQGMNRSMVIQWWFNGDLMLIAFDT